MTKAQHKTLVNAAKRPRANICPTYGVTAGAQIKHLVALEREGWAARDEAGCYRITDAGRAAIKE